MGKGDRGFAFTAWDMEAIADTEKLEAWIYIVIAPEVCPESGRPHLQGYVYFKENKTHSAAVKAIEKVFKRTKSVNVEVAKGTAEHNRTYIVGPYEKDGKVKVVNPDAKEYGQMPRQGKRNDLEIVREEVKAGKSMREIVNSATNFQQLKTAEFMFRYLERKRDWKPHVVYIWGLPGSGKTRYAYDRHGMDEIHEQRCDNLKWFQGYDAHEVVLLDEVDYDTDYSRLKALTDRYPCIVECKGGSRQFLAKTIYMTSTIDPHEVWQCKPYMGREMLRRVDEIVHLA